METAFVIIVLSIIGAVTYTINRKGKQEAAAIVDTSTITQETPAVMEMSPKDRVLLNAAKSMWSISMRLGDDDKQEWFIVDKRTGMCVFEVNEDTYAVTPIKRMRRKTTAKTN